MDPGEHSGGCLERLLGLDLAHRGERSEVAHQILELLVVRLHDEHVIDNLLR